MKPAVVIVNYRSAELTVDCLRSIEQTSAGQPPRTIVVENHSPDDSRAVLGQAIDHNAWHTWVELIEAEENGGFAAGNNIGIRRLLASDEPPDAILLLNPDTIVRDCAIDRLCAFLDEHPEAGLAGSRLEDPDSTPQRSAFRDPTPIGEFESAIRLGFISKLLRKWVVAPPVRDEPHQTDWVAGASLLVRREVFEDIGLLDDRYFMYYEEVDFCRRARMAGHACWYVPASRVVHLVGQSSGIVHGQPKRRPKWWFASRRRYFLTHFGRFGAIGADLAWLIGSPVFHMKRAVQRKPNPDPQRFLPDLTRNSALFNGLTP